MATIFFKPIRMPASPLPSPNETSETNRDVHQARAGSFAGFQPPLLTPTRSSSLRGFSRARSTSLSYVEPLASENGIEDNNNEVVDFEIDIDTPVSMCMRWQDIVQSSEGKESLSSTSSTTELGSPVENDSSTDEELPEFTHTYAKANAMSLRVNPNSGLLGFRKAARRGPSSSGQESSLGQTLVDSSYVLPTKKPPMPAKLPKSPPRPAKVCLLSSSKSDNPNDKKLPPSKADKPNDKKMSPAMPTPKAEKSSDKSDKILSIMKVFKADKSANSSKTSSPSTPPKPTSPVPMAKIHIEPPQTPPQSPPQTLASPTDTADTAEVDIDEDDSIFSSLRNVDLVSSHAPESARVRETKKKQEVNKNVVAFLGGYKQSGASFSSHRVKVTGDILNRAKSIRKRTAEGQLSRKLQDARMRIPLEFQNMGVDLPRKSNRKRIRFPDNTNELEHIYVFEVEDSEDNQDNNSPDE